MMVSEEYIPIVWKRSTWWLWFGLTWSRRTTPMVARVLIHLDDTAGDEGR